MGSDSEFGAPLSIDHERSMRTTWMISFNKDLWHGLLQAATNGYEGWPSRIREMACNKINFLNAMRLLLSFSMIASQESLHGSYTMHPVMHNWTSYIQATSERTEVLQLGLQVIGFLVPDCNSRDYYAALQRRLLPDAERCSWWIQKMDVVTWHFNNTTLLAVESLGVLYADQDKLKGAEAMYRRAFKGNEKAFGPDIRRRSVPFKA
jgi:hypothetical protein